MAAVQPDYQLSAKLWVFTTLCHVCFTLGECTWKEMGCIFYRGDEVSRGTVTTHPPISVSTDLQTDNASRWLSTHHKPLQKLSGTLQVHVGYLHKISHHALLWGRDVLVELLSSVVELLLPVDVLTGDRKQFDCEETQTAARTAGVEPSQWGILNFDLWLII